MARERFEKEMRRLAERVVELGGLAESAVSDSVTALQAQDLKRAQALIDADRRINEMRFELENEALLLIATQQPVAGDLRSLASVLEIATELERIADYAKGIATITLTHREGIPPGASAGPEAHGRAGLRPAAPGPGRLHLGGDLRLACAIPEEDGEVDALYEKIYRELAGRLLTDPQAVDHAMRLTWVAHNLERVADRVGNICERVVFCLTGSVQEMTDDSGLRRSSP